MHVKPKKPSVWMQLAYVIVGSLLMPIAYGSFFIPNDTAPGGLTGFSTLLHSLFGLPVGTITLVMNIPLFLLGWRKMGKFFALRSLLSTILVSVGIDFFPLPVLTENPLLASVFGGIIMGASLGLILKGNATSGGTDLLAALIADRFPGISLAWVIFGVDALVVGASAFVFQPESAMYALIALYLCSVAIDMVQEGTNRAKSFMIVTDKPEEISRRIIEELNHSVTLVQGRGMYSGKEKDVLFCVVYRSNVTSMKNIVLAEDPTAFCIVYDVRETLGEGFTFEHR